MRRLIVLLCIAALTVSCTHKTVDRVIRTEVPQRPQGQTDVLGLVTEKLDTVRIGVVGLGMRGSDAAQRLTFVPGVRVAAVCDVMPDRVESVQKSLTSRGLASPQGFSGAEDAYESLCSSDDVDLVYICTDWKHHVPVALCAMNHGKHVAVEVPAASTLEDIWNIVNTAERTRRHCFMLENCCYDFFELATLNMASQGLFGEVLHGEGAYLHNLDPFWDAYWDNWRLDFNSRVKGDVYPTHGFGPVCQVMNIHRGDRLKTLVAMETKAVNGPKHVLARTGVPCPDFANADETCTMIRTEKGKTILIEHDVLTPRPYNRMYQIVGSEGYAGKYPVGQLCFRENAGEEVDYQNLGREKILMGEELRALQEKYRHPILTAELEALAKSVGGHGGMDFLMDYRMVYCLRNGLPMDIDVYDLAEWCCVTELSRISIENGSAPVEVPDFTRGAWERVDGLHLALLD